MNKILFERGLNFARSILVVSAVAVLASCSQSEPAAKELTSEELDLYQRKLALRLQDPVARSNLIAKVMGSTVEDERHAFLKFHIFGYAGDGNLIPFFTMNNYIIQKWTPGDSPGDYEVLHYEVAYYSKFDSTEALEYWDNPLTGETLELPHFVLGPVPRQYAAEMSDSTATFAPDPLNITMIGDRVYIPTFSSFAFPNGMKPEEWGPYSNGDTTYWDSMLVFSADVEDVFDNDLTHVPAEMHMQNLVGWAPYLKLGQTPGRTMVRAYGQHISGYDALPKDIRAGLEKYTPEIFDLDGWTELRMDTAELAQHLMEQRKAGTLDIDQPDYVPFEVNLPHEASK